MWFWIEANPAGVLVGVGVAGIAGVGCVLPDGTTALNYVAPWAQRQGVAAAAGHTVCTLTSTAAAQGFYLAYGYEAAGEPVSSFDSKPAYPMLRAITRLSGWKVPCRSSG